MSWELFTCIVDQVPDVARVVLHGRKIVIKPSREGFGLDMPRLVEAARARAIPAGSASA